MLVLTLTNLCNMEIRVYLSRHSYDARKPIYCVRPVVSDTISVPSALDLFRSIYGVGCIVEFLYIS